MTLKVGDMESYGATDFTTDDLVVKVSVRYSAQYADWRAAWSSFDTQILPISPAWRARYDLELARRKSPFGIAFHDACMKQARAGK